MPVNLILNGEPRLFDLPGRPDVSALVAALGLKADRVAIEHNGAIVSRARWPETTLNDGDRLELVQFVGGGSPVS